MTTKEFEQELQAIDSRLAIVPNPHRPGLANIKLDGRDICPVPSEEIKEEPDNNYRYLFSNGMNPRHNSRGEALAKVHQILEWIKTKEGHEVFFETN